MKLQAKSSKALRDALQKAAKCIAAKSAVLILEDVLLTQRGKDEFFFTSSTGESQLVIPAPFTVVEGEFTKPLALKISLLLPFLGTLPDCTITFVFHEDTKIITLEYCTCNGDNVKSGNVQVAYCDGEAFPSFPSPSADSLHISLPYAVLAETISHAGNFATKNELRPVMASLFIDVSEDLSEIVFVATDAHVLYRKTYSNDPAKGGSEFYRSGKAHGIPFLSDFFRTMSVFDGNDTIDIESDGRVIRFTSGDIAFTCNTVSTRYPNYKAVIPRSNPYFVVIDKKEMLDILKRVGLFTNKSSNLIELKKDGMFLNVSASDIDISISASDQVLIADADCPDGFRIGINALAFLPCLNAIPDGTVRIQFADPTRAVVLTADSPSADTLSLCMPMLLN